MAGQKSVVYYKIPFPAPGPKGSPYEEKFADMVVLHYDNHCLYSLWNNK